MPKSNEIIAKDCAFFINEKECDAVKVMDCFGCPFYKNKDEYAEQLKKYRERKRFDTHDEYEDD